MQLGLLEFVQTAFGLLRHSDSHQTRTSLAWRNMICRQSVDNRFLLTEASLWR